MTDKLERHRIYGSPCMQRRFVIIRIRNRVITWIGDMITLPDHRKYASRWRQSLQSAAYAELGTTDAFASSSPKRRLERQRPAAQKVRLVTI